MVWSFLPSRDQESAQPLDVLIVGAGIGGLTAALGLRAQGHRVTLFEQSSFATETGAAIFLPPNANGLLRRHGFFAEEHRAVPCLRRKGFDDKGNLTQDFVQPRDLWEHPFHMIHRVALHSGIKQLVLEPSRDGPLPQLKVSSRIVSVDAENACITLENGVEFEGDVIIGADGVHSVTRKALAASGQTSPVPFGSGKNAFRFMVPRDVLQADARTRGVFSEFDTFFMWIGSDRRIVAYPCESNTAINCVALHDSNLTDNASGEDWNSKGDKRQLVEMFKSFPPVVQGLLDHVDPETLKLYKLLDMAQLPTWTRGKLALLGDAAHPFLPHTGQGGAQAIEDAMSLTAMLSAGVSPAEVPERLKLFEKARKVRAEGIQKATRAAGRDIPTQAAVGQHAQELSQRLKHDEWEHSVTMLKQWLNRTRSKL